MTRVTRYLKYVISTLTIFQILSCSLDRNVNKDQLISFMNSGENGLRKQESRLGVCYTLTYRPVDFIIEQEVKVNPNFDKDSIRKTYSDCLYFILNISRDSSETATHPSQSFTSYLKVLSFELKDYITLKGSNSKSILYLSDFAAPRTYGMTGSTSVILCFKDSRVKKLDDFTIFIKDFINGSEEELRFNFFIKDIKNTPTLELLKS